MKKILCLAASLLAAGAHAREIVTLPTRPGVTQSFFIAGMGGRRPEAAALLFIGGGGNIRLRMEDGQPRFGAQNFLPRSRREFIRNAILPVIMDAPSDQQSRTGMSDYYRGSDAQTADVRAVLAELKRRYPGLPVFIVGTSRGTLSAAALGRALGGEVAGVVLTASLFRTGRQPALAAFNFSSIGAPLLFVHHRDDACQSTPYGDAARYAQRYAVVSVKGGKPAESDACEPFSPHGFYGREAQTVDAIAGWMLKKPFPREIE